jgi:Kef-type K+ transport system membrane component KefB
MLDYRFFLDLAIILICTKLFGLVSRKVRLPEVVGALLAGLLLGPTVFNVVHETEFIDKMAELGVIMIMFAAGVQTDIKEMLKTGKASLLIAVLGVAIPLGGGFLVMAISNGTLMGGMTTHDLIRNLFIGLVLTATSVGITVEVLREMGRIKSKTGTVIIGAAIIDDIIGIILLTVISSMGEESSTIGYTLAHIGLFILFAGLCGAVFYYIFRAMSKKYGKKRRIPIIGFAFCLFMSYAAEHFFGVADITGAYLAGIIISSVTMSDYVTEKVEVTSYMLFSPIFFASIGIKITGLEMDARMLVFAVILLTVAIASKIIGCGAGALISGFSKRDSLCIGIGMICRSEVATIIVSRGVELGYIGEQYFAPVILIVIITSLVTPVLLKSSYGRKCCTTPGLPDDRIA